MIEELDCCQERKQMKEFSEGVYNNQNDALMSIT